jgi:hypothetical protein
MDHIDQVEKDRRQGKYDRIVLVKPKTPAERHELFIEGMKLERQMIADFASAAAEDYPITLRQAQLVEEWAYREFHSNAGDIHTYVDQLAALATNIITAGKPEVVEV